MFFVKRNNYFDREIERCDVKIGQIAQIKLNLASLKQECGAFTLRELLKSVVALDNEMSTVYLS